MLPFYFLFFFILKRKNNLIILLFYYSYGIENTIENCVYKNETKKNERTFFNFLKNKLLNI